MELDELTDKAIDYMLPRLADAKLSKWEESFIESVTDQWERNRRLSDNQKLKLGEIWDRV